MQFSLLIVCILLCLLESRSSSAIKLVWQSAPPLSFDGSLPNNVQKPAAHSSDGDPAERRSPTYFGGVKQANQPDKSSKSSNKEPSQNYSSTTVAEVYYNTNNASEHPSSNGSSMINASRSSLPVSAAAFEKNVSSLVVHAGPAAPVLTNDLEQHAAAAAAPAAVDHGLQCLERRNVCEAICASFSPKTLECQRQVVQCQDICTRFGRNMMMILLGSNKDDDGNHV